MSLPIVIANNQTAGPIVLDRLGVTVPASSTYTLTDTAFVDEILEDESLHAAIVANSILLDLGQGELSKGDSLKFFQIVTLEVRRPVRVLADANVASLSGTTTLDSVALAVDDRVVLTAQTTASENGIWVVKAGAWVRPTDFNTGDSAASALISVQEGTVYADQVWQVSTDTGSDIIGTDTIALQQISGGGGGSGTLQEAYEAGNTINATAGEGDIGFTLTSADFTVDGLNDFLIGASTALANFTVDAGVISLDSTDDSNFTMTANDAGAKTLTIAATNAGAGNGNVAISADGTVDMDGAGDVSVNSSGGAINIGDDADTGAINVGTGAAARNIAIGNATGATALDIDSGTGGTTIDSTGTISIDGVGNSNFTTDAGDLTLSTTTSGDVNVNSVDAVSVTSGTTTDIQSTGNVTVDSSGGDIGIGTDADTGAINIGTAASSRVIGVGNTTGTTATTVSAGTGGITLDATTTTVTGNLHVMGTTTTIDSEIVNVADNFLYLNDGYTSTSGLSGGTVTNNSATANASVVDTGGFTAGVGGVSNATVRVTDASVFSVGSFIQVSGAADQQNDGLYEVLAVDTVSTPDTLTIAGVGLTGATFQFTQTDFLTEATAQGAVTEVNIGVNRVNAAGVPQFAFDDNATTMTFNDIITGGTLTLQTAYDGGNTILTAGGQSVVISGSESLNITATGGINLDTVFDADVTTFDVQMTGTNGFSIDGTAASNVTVDAGDLTLATTTSGSVLMDGIDGVEINSSAGAINVGNDADTGAINVGTGAAARAITLGNTTGATGVTIESGTEKVEIDGITLYGAGAGLPTATGSGFQAGDKYFDTTLGMEMRYDAVRGKWLSVEAMFIQFGRNGNVGTGQYYRGIDRRIMSATLGYRAPYAGTIVEAGYTRTDTDAAVFDFVEGGTSRDTLATAALAGGDNTLDGDFSAGGILAVQNTAGGNATSNVMAWFKVRFRSA